MRNSSSDTIQVSVLIAAYNVADTIRAAVESVMSQTFKNFELIICDDASTDETLDILNDFRAAGITILSNEKNKGIAATRNVLLRAAKAPYIAWLDADDLMFPERLEQQLLYLQRFPELDIVSSYIMLENYSRSKRSYPNNPDCLKAMLLFKNMLVQPALMSKNFYAAENIFYNEDCDYIEDYELWSRLMENKIFGMVPEYLTAYTVPSEAHERRKRDASGWYANYDRLLKSRLSACLSVYMDQQQVMVLSEFLRTYNKMDHSQYLAVTAILNHIRKNARTGLIHKDWLNTVLLYLSLLAANRYSKNRILILLLRFSPGTWYRVWKHLINFN